MRLLAALLLVLSLAACSDDEPTASTSTSTSSSPPSGATASSPVPTLTPLPPTPEPPPTGTLIADLRQSSRDAAAGRFEVWIDNDTEADLTPTRVTYRDGRFRTALTGTRLREIPAQSERGFQVLQPEQPACGSEADAGSAEVTVDYRVEGRTESVTVPVEDEADVAGRYAASRCLELAVADVATLSWADEVPVDGAGGQGSTGTLTLQVETTGRPGAELVVDSISGTPILSAVGAAAWTPGLRITGDQPSTSLALPVKPTRCDAHAFAESGGATAFLVNLHLDGTPGQITVRMDPEGAANAIAFAESSCGDLIPR